MTAVSRPWTPARTCHHQFWLESIESLIHCNSAESPRTNLSKKMNLALIVWRAVILLYLEWLLNWHTRSVRDFWVPWMKNTSGKCLSRLQVSCDGFSGLRITMVYKTIRQQKTSSEGTFARLVLVGDCFGEKYLSVNKHAYFLCVLTRNHVHLQE